MRKSMVRALTLPGIVLGAATLAIGCGRSEGGSFDGERPAADSPAAATPNADGLLRISAESARYIGTEAMAASTDPVPLRLPARLEFRDGAVSEVGAAMAGRVTAVLVKSGDRVGAGSPLVTLSCPDAASARTGLAAAEAELKEARATLDRQNRMMDEGVGIVRDRLAAEVHLESEQAEVDRARATAVFAGAGSGAEVTLTSPIAGVVLALRATRGATVGAGGEALVEVGDPGSVWVVADVPERDLPDIVEGSAATLELTSAPEPIHAQVISIGAVVSSALRTAPVRMTLGDHPAGLRPGMYGWVRLETRADRPTLPVEAVLIKDGKDSVVYVAKDDRTFERRTVVVGRPIGGRVPVVSGVTAGERVVVRGALLLDGSAEQLL